MNKIDSARGQITDVARKFILELLNYGGAEKVHLPKLPQKETDIKKDRPEPGDDATAYMYNVQLPNKLFVELEFQYSDGMLDCYIINGWDNSVHGHFTFDDIEDATEMEKEDFVDTLNLAIEEIKKQGSGKFGAHSEYEIKSIDELSPEKLKDVIFMMWESLPQYGSGLPKEVNPNYTNYEDFERLMPEKYPDKIVKWANQHQWSLKNSVDSAYVNCVPITKIDDLDTGELGEFLLKEFKASDRFHGKGIKAFNDWFYDMYENDPDELVRRYNKQMCYSGVNPEFKVKSIEELDSDQLGEALLKYWKEYNPDNLDIGEFSVEVVDKYPDKFLEWLNRHEEVLNNSKK